MIQPYLSGIINDHKTRTMYTKSRNIDDGQ